VPHQFGHVSGVKPGDTFPNRKALAAAGVHPPLQAGISGNAAEGADSIVVSGGYEDDEDLGDVIVYTGQGGQDPVTRKQVNDQELTRGNLALARSRSLGRPVRVTRGANHASPYSPRTGFRYDGLFRVEDAWTESGKSGYLVWRFRLMKLEELSDASHGSRKPAGRMNASVSRIIRDTEVSQRVKQIHDYRCQICGQRIETPDGPYAEGAHIRPLGRPHDGPDSLDNILCLCPNHHVMFDHGAFTIADDLTLVGIDGSLRVHKLHRISADSIRYHREHYGPG